jgi:hypothetical protein
MFIIRLALSLDGCQLEGSSRPLGVKYAEDQHKKKELSRLHHLTIANAFRSMDIKIPAPKPDGIDTLNSPLFYQQQALDPIYTEHSPLGMGMGGPVHSSGGQNNWYSNMQQLSYMQSAGLSKNNHLGSLSMDMATFNQPQHLHASLSPTMIGSHSMSSPISSNSLTINSHGSNQYHLLALPQGFAGLSPKVLSVGTMNAEAAPMHAMGFPAFSTPSFHHLPPFSSPNQYPTLIISNLPNMANVNLLYELCSPYGRIVSADLEDSAKPRPPSDPSSSFLASACGKVVMENPSQAEAAMRALHGLRLHSTGPALQVSLHGSLLDRM